MKEFLKRWWKGELKQKHGMFVTGSTLCTRHWTSNFAHWAVSFYMREWKWTLGALGTIIAAFVFKKF